MFEGIRALLGLYPKRSLEDQKLDEALAQAESLDHYFFFSDRGHAEGAAGRLEQRGWITQSVSLHGEQRVWLLHMRQPGQVENLYELQRELDQFADEHHGEYDGWQVPGTEDL